MGRCFLLPLVATLLLLGAGGGDSARILAVFPSTFSSQVNVFTALTKQLARQGHQVTMLSPFPQKWAPPGYIDFDLMNSPLGQVKNTLANEGPQLFSSDYRQFHKSALYLWKLGFEVTQAVAQSQQLKDLMSNPNGFDLVITEYFLHEALHGLATFYKVPLVLFAPSNLVLTDPSPLSYVPHPLLSLNSPMTFQDRLINVLANTFWAIGYNFYYMPKQEAINKELFGADAPSVWDYEPSLILLNDAPVLDQAKPQQPSTVEVGGLHMKTELSPLPDDLQQFMDSADYGVIYFSFGSSLKCQEMPPFVKKAFLEAFKVLPHKVIWKNEEENLEGVPPNVKLVEWLPQQEILAHPKMRLMITHGGIVSGQEAAYNGVPVIAIPIFGEQQLRAERTQRDHFGLMLDVRNVSRDSLLWAMHEAMNNPRIKQATEQRARVLRDQPQPPLDRAVFWLEYVLRHEGAAHLRSAGRRLCWWQRHSLDVVVVLLATLLLLPLSLCALRRRRRPRSGRGK